MKQGEILDTARQLLDIEAGALRETRDKLDDNFISAVEAIYRCKGKVVVTGMGKSGLIGQKISATLASTGTPALSLHPADALHGDLGIATGADLILALSNSGETREILALLPSFKGMGLKIISITGNPDSTLSRESDIAICYFVQSEGCPLNLAPMASTTATLAVGDALAASLMQMRNFTPEQFSRYHPSGALGRRLKQVGEVMHKENLPIVTRETPLDQIVDLLVSNNRGAVLVVGKRGHLRGIISDGDIKRMLRIHKGEIFTKKAEEIMVAEPKYVFRTMLLEEAIQFMHENRISILPVLDNWKKIIGMVQLRDLLDLDPK